jgi:spore germination protein (amino acid permease)
MKMKRVGPISILHIVALSMTMIGLKNHVTILPPILKIGGRDGWMSVIIATIIIFGWIFLLYYVHKQIGQQKLTQWLKEAIGPKMSTLFRYVVSIFLIVLAAVTMREAIQWMKTTFLPTTSILVLLIIYIVLCILLATTNIQTIAILNVLVLFGVLVLGFFVAFVNIQVKDYSLLRPFLEHGWEPVFKASVYPAAGFVELVLLLFYSSI